MRYLALLMTPLLLGCSDIRLTGPPEVGYQRLVGLRSFCEWYVIPPAGYTVEGGSYDLTTTAGTFPDLRLSDDQVSAIHEGSPVRFWAVTRDPFTVDLRLDLRDDTTYTGYYNTLRCER